MIVSIQMWNAEPNVRRRLTSRSNRISNPEKRAIHVCMQFLGGYDQKLSYKRRKWEMAGWSVSNE
jgi:hypothetical protein